MSERFKNADVCQSGACNPRPISKALHDAIGECYTEGVSPAEDPAVFLILHQLAYVLTGYDIALASPAMGLRYTTASNTVIDKLKAD